MKSVPEAPALVFFDIDGTLLDTKREVPPSAAKAISQLRENGHLALINTGRCPASILPHILEIGFDGIVASCGTYIEYRDDVLFNLIIEQDLLAQLLPLIDQAPIEMLLEGPEFLYVRDLSLFQSQHMFSGYFYGHEHIFRDWHDTPVVINKMSFALESPPGLDCCRHLIEPNFDLIPHSPLHGELVPKGHNKATGIERLLRHLDLPRSNTYAFGDSLNDLDMLSYAAHGIAMADSRSTVLSISDYVTSSAEEDGIARGLRHYGLI
ncbi:MAG: Cof-type HAD-IIB family hydrolase [Saccharofermentanales bacterium]